MGAAGLIGTAPGNTAPSLPNRALLRTTALPRFARSGIRRRTPIRWADRRLHALLAGRMGCIGRRMPRMQVYLPEELYQQVKARELPVSELLQKALAAEMRRQDLLAETERYLAGLVKKVGEPSPAEQARADTWVRKATRRPARKAG